jgi:hypothetical protein
MEGMANEAGPEKVHAAYDLLTCDAPSISMIQSVATTIVTGEHTTKPSATLEWSAWEAERGGNGREVNDASGSHSTCVN